MALGLLPRLALLCGVGVLLSSVDAKAQQPARPATTASEIDTGKKLFVQRCSVCHMPPMGPGQPRPVARLLAGLVKSPETEAVARLIIQKGIPTRMPGFEYGLEPREIDSIVAYLRTVK
jgi:mono/diheme cytochrome c family protein